MEDLAEVSLLGMGCAPLASQHQRRRRRRLLLHVLRFLLVGAELELEISCEQDSQGLLKAHKKGQTSKLITAVFQTIARGLKTP